MGAYGARTRKPTILFGSASGPHMMSERSRCCLPSPWLGSFKRKLSEKDKERIERLAKDKGRAMVKKKVDQFGRVRVHHVCNRYTHL